MAQFIQHKKYRERLPLLRLGRFGKRALARFAQDDSGQAITEYILLLSLSVTFAVAMARALTGIIDQITAAFGAELEKNIKTGRADVSIWSN